MAAADDNASPSQHRASATPQFARLVSALNNNQLHVKEADYTSPSTDGKTYETPPTNDGGRGDDVTADVQQFYSGASVLVTGATGFMGKVLVEKLLRSCPGINTVFLLVRGKKGKSVEERIDELTASPCFDRLKTERPGFKAKLVAVTGDLGSSRLGLSDTDAQLLRDDVSVVFHVAATVRFDEQINLAIEQNVKGTRELLELCRTFSRLKSVVHVSTAYANCQETEIHERFYESPLDCDTAISMAETVDKDILTSITAQLLGKWPNTYAFTKAVSEHVIKKHARGLPVGVFRPAIVVCTNEEPMPGWIDNLYGPTGVIVGVASGLMRTLHVDGDIAANVVPCDMVINAMVVTAWDVWQHWRAEGEQQVVPVYNYVAPRSNPTTWHQFMCSYKKHGGHHPTSRAIWYYCMLLASNRGVYLLLKLLLHVIPGLLMDAGLALTGHKPQMLRIYGKIHKFSDVLSYFGLREWRFEDERVRELWRRLPARDQQTFPFDMRALSWDKFIAGSCPGLREHLMKDPISTLPQAKIRMQRLYWLHRSMQLLLCALAAWVLWAVWNTALSTSSYLTSGVRAL